MASAAGSGAAVPFWRAAGMTYITYSNICANLVRNCLKEPYKTEALSREKSPVQTQLKGNELRLALQNLQMEGNLFSLLKLSSVWSVW
ncbi:hypothetical protein L1049_003881 [Liquidambar formosana]|uniref:ATP synthase subunit epsilon, mitochondrial n=1 Tax=Liquidambar formosana TaxID=63359 RepID=A0AAP0WZT1_LIQFO